MPIGAVIGAAAIGGVATVAAGASQKHAIDAATQAQTQANDASIALQGRALTDQESLAAQQRADMAPWRQAGVTALQTLAQANGFADPTTGAAYSGQAPAGMPAKPSTDFGSFSASPDYQFRTTEGERAITGNAAAKGLLDSGSLGTGLINYAGASASQEYNNWYGRQKDTYDRQNTAFGDWYNRIASLADVGQTATEQTSQNSQAAQNGATGIINNQAGTIQQNGQNLASGYLANGQNNAGLITSLGGITSGLISNIGGGYPSANPVNTATTAFPQVTAPQPVNVQGFVPNTGNGGLFGSVI